MSSLGLEDYGSGSEDEAGAPPPAPAAGPSTAKGGKKGAGLNLPAPKGKKRDGPVVITVEKPKRPATTDVDDQPAKRPRIEAKKGGKSSLLDKLPPPSKDKGKSTLALPPPKKDGAGKGKEKQGEPTPEPTPEASEYSEEPEARPNEGQKATVEVVPADVVNPWELEYEEDSADDGAEGEASAKEKYRKMWEQQSIENVYELGEAFLRRREYNPEAKPEPEKPPEPPKFMPEIIAAPILEEWENFVPPEPKPDDPYPGYFRHPSGAWEMHDEEYYMKCYAKWLNPDADDPGPPPKEKGFEGYRNAYGVDARKRMEEAEIERVKAATANPAAAAEKAQPKMTLNASKTNSVARSRHQLSTLLSEAYSNREALEEKIAQGKRNRKEAGKKYGF